MRGLISQATREQIRAANDIVDVIGSYLPLKRAGANFVAVCPFHKEKTPSFNVNPQRQVFHCFGCHKGGDVFRFVQEYENINFPEAVQRLAERARIPLEIERDPAQQKSRFLKETLLQIHEQITQRWQAALAQSRRAVLEAGCAVVCGGQLDLIACYMAGVRNVVAPQGTALTGEHARVLKRYVDEVVLGFDSDTAGRDAAIRALDDLLASGLAIRVASVPAPHDPDSFIKASGGAAFQQLIDQAEGFFDFYLNHLCATHDVGLDKGRVAVVRGMGEALHKTGNAVLVDTYAQKTARRLGVASEAVRAEFKKILLPKRS